MNVLHLEGAPDDADRARAMLTAEWSDCVVVPVTNRITYLTELQAGGYDLVLSDHGPDSPGGQEALRLARELLPGVPFIFWAHAIGDDLVLDAVRAGALDCVLKDDPKRLILSVHRALHLNEERHRREHAERRQREQAEALDKANEAIVLSDLEHCITVWNRGAERMLGWTAAEMIGQPVNSVFAFDGGSREAEVQDTITRLGHWLGEVQGFNRRGDPLIIEMSITPLHDETGRPSGRISISTDITEKKRLAEQYYRAQRLESLGMLAAGITHDLNNILAPIGMASTLLRRHATEESDLRLLDTLEKCADRGASLVKQILGFARGISGEPRLVQPKHVLRDVVEVITETFPKSIVLDENIPRDLWTIVASPTRIHQVVLNLCVNARDAMPAGGTLRLRAGNCSLDETAAHAIEGASPGNWLVIHVEDTGTGITPEVLPRIWDPFFTTKTADKGTGLGLATVRGIVETHRGFVSLRSAPGKGSEFRVYLPAQPEPPPVVAGAVASDLRDRGHGERILFVDDEEAIRLSGTAILKQAGYEVVTAKDGREAVAWVQNHATGFALVITDLDMPNLDGAGLTDALRTHQPGVKVLAMSGLSSRSMEVPPEKFADRFIRKPFTAALLLQEIAALLRGSGAPDRP